MLFVGFFLTPSIALGYVGPGAGVAFLSTVFVLITTVFVAFLGLLFWPFRQVYLRIKQKRPPLPPKVKRAVLVGLDGLDPDIAEKMMGEGQLPNLRLLREKGGFHRLRTTYPAMSPVAWSSFATGVHPAKHGIFDFLTRDEKTYLPDLSSAEIGSAGTVIKIGKYHVPVGKPVVKLLRKSVPFWQILGKYGITSSILRVPITFPAVPFEGGTMLSAMCVPDLKGSQGSFTYYSSADSAGDSIGGERVSVSIDETHKVHSFLEGPINPLTGGDNRLKIPFTLSIDKENASAALEIGDENHTLKVNEYSPWVPIAFSMGLGMKLRGIVRFRLLETSPDFRLYASPINVDPARPILPISHPIFFSVFLSKLMGPFATLGLAEDTWALNEGVIDEDAFLEQAWDNHAERESMFFEMLDRTPEGVITCVFDGSDRIQHMFMRFMDDGHPARPTGEKYQKYEAVIPETYSRLDEMLGKVYEKVGIDDPETLVLVLSDHGFKTFRRGINLNSWLHQEGYLVLKEGATVSREWFQDVDWSRTRAFGLGLGGIFLNIKGREAQGFIEEGAEADALATEIAERLTGMRDEELDTIGIRTAYATKGLYKGPYMDRAPDVIVGYEAGWRASWNGVRGIVNDVIFDDNTKAWSGDHCIDPELVPGVLFSNMPFNVEEGTDPAIVDLAPTLLELFGVKPPRYMDGRSLLSA